MIIYFSEHVRKLRMAEIRHIHKKLWNLQKISLEFVQLNIIYSLLLCGESVLEYILTFYLIEFTSSFNTDPAR